MYVNSDLRKPKVKIWGVVEGPISVSDIDDIDTNLYMNLCKVEVNGSIQHIEYFFDTMDDAYNMCKHFLTSIDPLEVELNDDDWHCVLYEYNWRL